MAPDPSSQSAGTYFRGNQSAIQAPLTALKDTWRHNQKPKSCLSLELATALWVFLVTYVCGAKFNIV